MSPPMTIRDQALLGAAQPSGGSWMDDSGLKAYWKFDAVSPNNVVNASLSSDSLGTDGDLVMTGGTYEQSAVGSLKSILFDGTDDFAQASSGSNTLSQFNFLHEGQSTMCFWMKLVSSYNYGLIFNNNDWTPDAGTLLLTTRNASCGTACGTMQQPINNGAPLEANSVIVDMQAGGSNFGYIPDITDYYFYTIRVDVDEATDTGIYDRDEAGSAESKHDRINAPDTGVDSPSPFTIARRSNASQYFANILLSEFSFWDRILLDSEVDALWANGSGKAIYE